MGVKFDKTIHLGHLLQIAAFLGTIAALWINMDRRVTVLEQAILTADRDRERIEDATASLVMAVSELQKSNARLEALANRRNL